MNQSNNRGTSTGSSDQPQRHSAELLARVARLPRLPGVYLMKDADGQVIYVGKAKELRTRVRSYFRGGDERVQVEFLLKRVVSIDTVVTSDESQAFVLERDLIGQHKPRYNIRLKDDKSFLSVRIATQSPWPRVELVRRVQEDGARYFGPYSFSYELRTLVDIIKRTVPLRTCTDTVFHNRTRPCLEYQIKRCAGPCCLKIDEEQYHAWVKQAVSILEGKTDAVVASLETEMIRASAELRFEDAATIRDRLAVLEQFRRGSALVSSKAEDRDVFACKREAALVVVSVLKVRGGRVRQSQNFAFEDVQLPTDDLLQSVIEQYYGSSSDVPPEIVVPFALPSLSWLTSWLKERRDGPVEIQVPQRGLKVRLLELARMNAEQHFIGLYGAEERNAATIRELSLKLKLHQIPRRIECLDISNLQGSNIVGAIVAFRDGQIDKENYRTYRIRSVPGGASGPDDFASIEEVVERRLQRAQEFDDAPDLLIIDGGRQQLERACRARDRVGVALEIVSLAKERNQYGPGDKQTKKPERVFVPGVEEPIVLAADLAETLFMQRIRDEAHRFVIGFHRKQRSARAVRSVLDEVSGLGPERRKRLLRHFGNVAAVAKAPVEEVATIGRMPRSLAAKVLQVLAIKQQGSD